MSSKRHAASGSDAGQPTTPPGPAVSNSVADVIRYALTLSGIAMVAMAVLTLLDMMPFPRWTAMMFMMVAFVDILIGVVVLGGFGKGRAEAP